ncbi:aldo/keto reductase [Propionibacteriaceae bacterium Y2011]
MSGERGRVRRLGFGSANAGNLYEPMSDEQAEELFTAAWEAGVRHFDTAPHYGLGLAEERLGRFLAQRPRDEFFLSTKVGRLVVAGPSAPTSDAQGFKVSHGRGRVVDYSRDGVRRSLAESLQRLGLDRVDAVYVHDPEQLGDELITEHLTSAIPACQELRDEGVVDRIGVGSCAVPALQAGVEHGGIDEVMAAGVFTLLTQRAYPELLAACDATGVQVLATAPFNSGLLATHPPRADSHFDYGDVPDEQFEQALELAGICQRYGVELPTAALQFPLRYEPCRMVVTGAATPEQVRETTSRMSEPVPDELWVELRRLGHIP